MLNWGVGTKVSTFHYYMKILLLLALLLSGCTTVYEMPSAKQMGTFRFSNITQFTCSLCKSKTALYKLDKKNRVVCDKCYYKSKKKDLYH